MSEQSKYSLSKENEQVIRASFELLTGEVVGYAKAAGWRDNPEDEARERELLVALRMDVGVAPSDVLWLVDRIEKKKKSDGTTSMLLVSEIAEGFEGMRAKLKTETVREFPDNTTRKLGCGDGPSLAAMEPIRGYNASKKIGPEFNTTEEEWADVVIRLIDESDRLGLDLVGAVFAKARFNRLRPFRHGGKRV